MLSVYTPQHVITHMKNCIIHGRLTLYYLCNATIYMILMQYFIFYKSHDSNVFNFPILFVLAAWQRNDYSLSYKVDLS